LLPDETSRNVAIRPTNLTYCPENFDTLDDYLLYRDSMRANSMNNNDNPKNDVGALLHKLRSLDDTALDDQVCVICLQPVSKVSKDDHSTGLGRGTRLPCGIPFI